jgi:hypothetical protein
MQIEVKTSREQIILKEEKLSSVFIITVIDGTDTLSPSQRLFIKTE